MSECEQPNGRPRARPRLSQACTSLVKLSVTRAELPMGELLDGSTRLDLEGKGLGRTEMGIVAQVDHRDVPRDTPEIHPRYTRDTSEIHPRYTRDTPEMHPRCAPSQILRKNSTLKSLKLTDNCMGKHGLLALSAAIAHARPPLEEVRELLIMRPFRSTWRGLFCVPCWSRPSSATSAPPSAASSLILWPPPSQVPC